MRSALLFATFALSTFASPIALPIDSNPGCLNAGSKRNDQVDPACKISHPRGVEGSQKPNDLNIKREPIYKSSGRRAVGNERDTEDVEVRNIRNQGSKREAGVIRGGKDIKRSDEDVEDVEARNIRNQDSKREAGTPRSAEAEPMYVRGGGRRSVEVESEVEDTYSKRDPINRGANSRREADPVNRINGREPEPAVSHGQSNTKTCHPLSTRC